MSSPTTPGIVLVAMAVGLSLAPAGRAATTAGNSFATGSVCQLSIPSIDTKFRPKATGARNESATASSFVICPLRSTIAGGSDVYTAISVAVYSIDGAHHDVSCTAVAGLNGRGVAYSTKSVPVNGSDDPAGATATWPAADFFGTAGTPIPGSISFSVTCNLPPQTAVNSLEGDFEYEIGS